MESSKALQEEIDKEIRAHFSRVIEDLKAKGLDPFLLGMYDKIQRFVSLGGKRLRPISSLMAFRACCPPEKATPALRAAAMKAALGFELLHNSTLIHDDIMDQDELRRGAPTVWKMFANDLDPRLMAPECSSNSNNSNSNGALFRTAGALHCVTHGILSGNILVGEALRLVTEAAAEAGCPGLLQVFVDAYLVVNYGQVEDISGRTGEAEYMRMIEKKTGALFKCAILGGATLAGADAERLAALERYSLEAAAAFQLFDDVMDIDPSSLKGHVPGSDIRQGKMTLLAVRALKNAPKDKSEKLARALAGNAEVSDEMIAECVQIIRDYSLDSVKETTEECVRNAKEALTKATWSSPDAIKYFVNLADFVSNRKI